MDFSYSDRVRELQQRVSGFMYEFIYPAEAHFHEEVAQNRRAGNVWQVSQVMEELKRRARGAGLWNLFLPESELGAGLSNLEDRKSVV